MAATSGQLELGLWPAIGVAALVVWGCLFFARVKQLRRAAELHPRVLALTEPELYSGSSGLNVQLDPLQLLADPLTPTPVVQIGFGRASYPEFELELAAADAAVAGPFARLALLITQSLGVLALGRCLVAWL